MLRQVISLLLSLVMIVSLLPAQTFAADAETEPTEQVAATEATEETTAPTETETEPLEETAAPTEAETEPAAPELIWLEAPDLDSEELLLGYLDPLYHGEGISLFGTQAREGLSAADRHLYDGLKERIMQLAIGAEDNTEIEVDFTNAGCSPEDVDISLVQEALMFDFPFEMYWYSGCWYGAGDNCFFIVMKPNAYYMTADFDPNTSPYIDKEKTGKAAAAAENIHDIKARYEAYDDYDKLAAYADEICALVEYDHDAADNNTYDTNINPWTLINVFDGDSTTNVVCEGYAEAFQYLCEESDFREDVLCISVTGNYHKWNIVRINGVSYLMDVTACDMGSTAYKGLAFLGGGEGSVADGYLIGGFLYSYYDETLAIYGSGEDSILKLSSVKYTPVVTYSVVYDANGGTGAPNSQRKKEGVSLTLRETVPVREGYAFLGWATSASATTASYQPGDTYSADADLVLYAVWEKTVCAHSFGDYNVINHPACEAPGAEERVCALCGETESREVPATGHSKITLEAVAPTCTEDGLTEGECCMSCGEVFLKQEVIPAGHTEVVDEAVAATCTENGLTEGRHCSVCGEVLAAREVIEAPGHTFGAWTPVEDGSGAETVKEQRICGRCNETETRLLAVVNRVIAELGGYAAVWIDGKEYAVQQSGDICYIDLPHGNARTMVAYTYHVDDASDIYTQYPVGMKVWTLENTDGIYTSVRQTDFDDILQYSGTSIRVTGKKGIRMITSMKQDKKKSLTSDGLAGYTLKEYGTAIAWANQLSADKPLVLGQSYIKSNYAYKKDVADPVFAADGGLMQYTNVLVGFSDAQCKKDIAMRSYMILEDAQGREITLYGGIVQRSIGYIAYQNRNVFEAGTEAYEYVWDIIHSVYGDIYDGEYAA